MRGRGRGGGGGLCHRTEEVAPLWRLQMMHSSKIYAAWRALQCLAPLTAPSHMQQFAEE